VIDKFVNSDSCTTRLARLGSPLVLARTRAADFREKRLAYDTLDSIQLILDRACWTDLKRLADSFALVLRKLPNS